MLYKATHPDGTDFQTGTILYEVDTTVTHPAKKVRNDPAAYLSVSTVPTDCTGFRWPCRLFAVEGIGQPMRHDNLPSKRCFTSLRVVEELPAWQVFGPYGQQVVTIIERTLTPAEARRLDAAWDATWGAAWNAAWDAAALVVRDLITPEQFDILTGPWREVIGEIE